MNKQYYIAEVNRITDEASAVVLITDPIKRGFNLDRLIKQIELLDNKLDAERDILRLLDMTHMDLYKTYTSMTEQIEDILDILETEAYEAFRM